MQRSMIFTLFLTVAAVIGFAVATSGRADAGTCSVSGSWPFGTFNAFTFQASSDTIGASVTVNCSNYTPNAAIGTITINLTAGTSGSASSRYMVGSPSSNHFPYSIICSDTTYCKPGSGGKAFFDGTSGTAHIVDSSATANAAGSYTKTYATQAVIAQGTDPVVAGPSTLYTDNLTLTVLYP